MESLINKFQNKMGQFSAWLILLMAVLTFVIVILRYVFNSGWVWLQEFVVYLHAIIFLMSMGYALLKDGHVRVDIIYAKLSAKKKAWIDLLGTLFLLIPTCSVIFYQAWPYVVNSWAVFESSQDAEGLSYVYILKTFILLSMTALSFQGVSLILKNIKVIKNG